VELLLELSGVSEDILGIDNGLLQVLRVHILEGRLLLLPHLTPINNDGRLINILDSLVQVFPLRNLGKSPCIVHAWLDPVAYEDSIGVVVTVVIEILARTGALHLSHQVSSKYFRLLSSQIAQKLNVRVCFNELTCKELDLKLQLFDLLGLRIIISYGRV